MPPNAFSSLKPLYAELLDNSVPVPGPELERLADTAHAAGANVVIGFNERNAEASGTTLYSSTIVLCADGRLRGHHRRLVPTEAERTVHAYGDGSTLGVVDIGGMKLGTLICWENYMPLARYALYGMGTEILAMPTWDHFENFRTAARHIAYEGHVVAITALIPLHVDDVPAREEFEAARFPDDGWLNRGGSCIVDPLGNILAGPLFEQEGILYAEVSRAMWRDPRLQLGVAGHYGCPDVFDLRIDKSPRPMVRAAEARSAARGHAGRLRGLDALIRCKRCRKTGTTCRPDDAGAPWSCKTRTPRPVRGRRVVDQARRRAPEPRSARRRRDVLVGPGDVVGVLAGLTCLIGGKFT